MPTIPEALHDLFEKRTIAHVATLMPDGAPQSTPVWIEYDAEADRLRFNTERGRRKEKNLRRDPRVAISMTDPEDHYRMLTVRGVVEEITAEGADDHIDRLAKRYTGREEYPNPVETERVIVTVRPEHVDYAKA